MKRYAFFEVFKDPESKGIMMLCTESSTLEEVTDSLEKSFNQLNLKAILKQPDGSIYQYSLDITSDLQTSVLWKIFKSLCDSGWEPLGSSHFVYGGEYRTSSIETYQFKKPTETSN